MNDDRIFQHSPMGRMLKNNDLALPKPKNLKDQGPILPFVFVGDATFQLTLYMIRPYPRNSTLTNEKRLFNYRLNRARRTIENTFRISLAKGVYFEGISTQISIRQKI